MLLCGQTVGCRWRKSVVEWRLRALSRCWCCRSCLGHIRPRPRCWGCYHALAAIACFAFAVMRIVTGDHRCWEECLPVSWEPVVINKQQVNVAFLVHVNHIGIQINHSKIQLNKLFSWLIQLNKMAIQCSLSEASFIKYTSSRYQR